MPFLAREYCSLCWGGALSMRAKGTTSQHIRLQPFGKICLGRCSTKNLFATRERRRVCASPQSKTHQEQCILKSSLTSGSNFSVALNGQTRGTPSEPAEWADTSVVGTDK